jgi:pimeloyl-CoA synthetase
MSLLSGKTHQRAIKRIEMKLQTTTSTLITIMEHHCKTEANHPLVDLLEDIAYFNSALKDENWGCLDRAFKTAARAIEELDFEVKNALELSSKGSHQLERVGERGVRVMQSIVKSGKKMSGELEAPKKALKKNIKERSRWKLDEV